MNKQTNSLDKRANANNVCVCVTEDGKEMKVDIEKMKIKEIQNEVDRHSRVLRKAEDLSGN